jgi:hypothetical protein
MIFILFIVISIMNRSVNGSFTKLISYSRGENTQMGDDQFLPLPQAMVLPLLLFSPLAAFPSQPKHEK